jgi:hypothetical protein
LYLIAMAELCLIHPNSIYISTVLAFEILKHVSSISDLDESMLARNIRGTRRQVVVMTPAQGKYGKGDNRIPLPA